MREVALVTGASSGIGLEIAKILASQNYNLIICARREKELLELSNYISEKYSVDCNVVVADLTTDEGVDLLIKESPNVDILVNKSGKIRWTIVLSQVATKLCFIKNAPSLQQ